MINILIVDDEGSKQKNIYDVVKKICDEDQEVCIEYANDIAHTKSIMEQKDIDIMILDLCIPVRMVESPVLDGGITLINQLKASKKYRYPNYVISLSQHEDTIEEFKIATGKIHKYIYYDAENKWMMDLEDALKAQIEAMKNTGVHRIYNYDIAVICALSEELEQVKNIMEDVQDIDNTYDDFLYFEGKLQTKHGKIKIVATNSTQMGMVAAATLTTKLIYNFSPKYIVMTGIAAGVKNKVKMGDAVVAEYAWDYGAGKEIINDNGEKKHRNTIQQVHIDAEIIGQVRKIQTDNSFLESVRQEWEGNKPDHEFNIVIGAVASGAAVIADPDRVKDIIDNQVRDLIAVEMEVYGVYYAAYWAIKPKPKYISIKSVCDYADTEKNDDFHEYASYTSVKVFEKLAKDYFSYE